MPNIARKLQQLFGANLAAPSNIAKFGSLAAGAPAYSLDPDQIQTARYLDAWAAALINAPGGLASPALQDMNALFYLITYQLGYLLQKGMPDWLTTETYYTDDFVKVGGVVFISKQDNNVGKDPLTEPDWWKTLGSTLTNSDGICKAWVNFDGTTGAINSAFNVSSVSRTAVGCYQLNFAVALPNVNYAWVGSCGNPPSGVYINGNDNHIVGGAPGKLTVKTVNALSVFCYDRGDVAVQDSNNISVQVFGTG